jgi:HEAT repeat protein
MLLGLLAAAAPLPVPTSARTLTGASWIWTREGNARASAPAGNRLFRTVFTLPDDYQREGANLLVTADNLFAAYVNGSMVGENDPKPDSWRRPRRIDVTDFLRPGENCLAIEARNTIPGPAGLLAKLVVFLGADQTLDVVTDQSWQCANAAEPGWTTPAFAGKWGPVGVLGPLGVGPWKALTPPKQASRPLSFEGCQWVWTVNPDGTPDLAQASRCFRRSFDLPDPLPKSGLSVELLMTADNCFQAALNGKIIARSRTDTGAWRRPVSDTVTDVLRPGWNVFVVRADNILPGAAGLLGVLRIEGLPDGPMMIATSEDWQARLDPQPKWKETTPDEPNWTPAKVLGPYGMPPWGRIERTVDLAAPVEKNYPREESCDDPIYQPGIVFVRGHLPLQRGGRDAFVVRVRGTRAYTEMDVPGPAVLGTQLLSLVPCRPDGELRVLCDAAGGVLGSPAVSYDGKRVFFAMAKAGEPYFHLYVVERDGTGLRQLTDGPFHDFDPVQLPDGRLAFSSTRAGTCEEYHGVPACAIYSCDPEGKDVQSITSHIVFDREPKVTASGSLVFVRSDNFLERAKVEVHVHETHLDGTAGTVIIGPGRGGLGYDGRTAAESNGRWLRQYGAGCPTPLPDGRVLALTQAGLVSSASVTGSPVGGGYLPYDLAALPDGRLMCTDLHRRRFCLLDLGNDEVTEVLRADDLTLPEFAPGTPPVGLAPDEMHSVQPLSPRPPPAMRPSMVRTNGKAGMQTGLLYCQNVRNTQQKGVDASRIRAIRIYEGRPFSIVPTKSIYVHIGTEGVELGTIPVGEDGSFTAEVPADRALSLQAVDGEGRAVISELSWIYVRPGEFRSCIGCHAPQSSTPPAVPSRFAYSPPLAALGQGAPHRFRANNAANGGILNLQLERFREAGAISLFANSGPTGSRRQDVAVAIQKLTEGSASDQISAAQQLAILRERKAVPALVQALQHETPEVRTAAAVALSACGDARAVPPLRQLLADSHSAVSQAAKNALDHLVAKEPLPEDLMAMTPSARQGLFEAWGHTGDDAACAALRRHLTEQPGDDLRVIMAAMRALGQLKDATAVAPLAAILQANLHQTRNGAGHEAGQQQRPVYLAATAAEALGRIGSPEAEKALLAAIPELADFSVYTFNCGDHTWLMGCHSSVVHYRILEALDRMETTDTAALVSTFLRSVPIDKDRGLLYELDAYETLAARVIRRSGSAPAVVETCLAQLGDPEAKVSGELAPAVAYCPHAQGHIRQHAPPARAAQLLSIVCQDTAYAPRIRARLEEFVAQPESETRSWVCFFLARSLGQLRDRDSLPLLRKLLVETPSEAELGMNPPPNHWPFQAMKPFYRSAVADSLGRFGDRAALSDLLRSVSDYRNAPAVRRQCAVSLGRLASAGDLDLLRPLAETYPELATRRCLQEAYEAAAGRN